jgi:hypothetical protein
LKRIGKREEETLTMRRHHRDWALEEEDWPEGNDWLDDNGDRILEIKYNLIE